MNHQKQSEDKGKDFRFDLRYYLKQWLLCYVVSYEWLKYHLVADQIQKRTKTEMRNHCLDK